MKLRIAIAERRSDVLRAQYFIAEIYNRHYQIMFSENIHDLEARIEPYPHRYLTGTVDGELVAAIGLYTRDTYVERYGEITEDEIQSQLQSAGVADRYQGAVKRELTKLVVKDGWEGMGLARRLHTVAHAAAFTDAGAAGPVLIMVCGKVSVIEHLFRPRGEVTARFMAPFPRYPVHEEYRSDQDPMESRVTIPAVDVPPQIRGLSLPLELELPERARRAAETP